MLSDLEISKIAFSSYQSQFQEMIPSLKKLVKGKDNVKLFGERIGVCTGTMYSYLRGGIPNLAVCKLIVEEGLKVIKEEESKLELLIENI